MSPVSGRYPAGSSSTYSSTVYSSTATSSSRPYGGLESVPSHPYSGNAPNAFSQPHPDTYALSEREAQRSHRLPPPQSLVAGVPWASDTDPFRTHERRYHTPSAYHHQDGTGPNAPSPSPIQSPSLQSSAHIPYPLPPAHAHAAPAPLRPPPPPHPPAAAAAAAVPVARPPPPPPPPPAVADVSSSHRAFPTQSVSDLPQPQRQPLPGALPPSRLPIDSITQRYSQQPEPSPSQASVYRSHQPQPPPYDDRLNIHQTQQHQTPSPAPDRTRTSRTQIAQPPSRLHRAENASPTNMIPNLLGPDRADALSGIKFQLKMRQQPHAARACGFGDRDRRVIDPPPIVQLVIESPYLSTEEVRTYLRYESYVMSCSIYDETGTRDSTYMPDEYQNQRRLMGSLISTPFVGQDENHVEGCFFCFSDLSCRTPGTFRLNFTLMMIDPSRAGAVKHFPILASTMSEPFKVFNAKEFPGMVASSKLAKRLKEQGCIISIKKGNERNERGERGERSERNEESERTERTETSVRGERNDRYERHQRNERPKQSRPQDDLSDNDENSSRGQRKRRALEILAGLD